MSTSTIVIIAAGISCLIGIKKPLIGAIAGAVIAPILHMLFATFNLITFIVLVPVGFLSGFAFSFVTLLIYSGFRGKPQTTGPTIIGQSGGHGFSEHTGGIILSDQEKEGINPSKGKPKLHK